MKHRHVTVDVLDGKEKEQFTCLRLSRPDGTPIRGLTILRVYPDNRAVVRDTEGLTRIVPAVLTDGWLATSAALIAQSLAAVAEALGQVEDSETVALPAIRSDAVAWDARYGAALDAGEDTAALDREAKAIRARLDAEARRISFHDDLAERLSREAYDAADQHGFGGLARTLYRWSRGMAVCDPPPGEGGWAEGYRLAARGLLRAVLEQKEN